jgi:butyryl-CoA dehydrogenase
MAVPELPIGRAASPKSARAYVQAQLAPFLAEEINPGAAERDARDVPFSAAALQPAVDLGLLGFLLPREFGGAGGDRRTFGLLLEQIGYFCEELEYASLVSMYADIAAVIAEIGRSDLIERYVVPMSRGSRFGTFAYTERTDALDFCCRAVKTADRYVLDGEKCLQTGGHLADVFLTYVRDDHDDLKLFLVERADHGVEIAPVGMAGFRAAGLTRLTLRGVELDESRLLVGVDALSHAQRFLNGRRLFIACPMVGRMAAILESVATHLAGVVRYGRPLSEQPAVHAKLGRMFIRYEAARAVLHAALDRWSEGEHNALFDPGISAAKYIVVDSATALAMDAIHLSGWRGYSRELPYERYLRAFMSGIAGQTSQDVIELLLGNEVIAHSELTRHRKGTRP